MAFTIPYKIALLQVSGEIVKDYIEHDYTFWPAFQILSIYN